MKLSDLPHLSRAIDVLGLDIGADAKPDVLIPAAWEERCRRADAELSRISPQEQEVLVIGEYEDQKPYILKCPHANGVLEAAFDGPLSDTIFTPWTCIHDARAAEDRVLRAGRAS